MMKRILVTGNAGSGKSTLAQKISQYLDIPVYSLDQVVWQPGWKKTPENERNQLISALTKKESWVIDGVSNIALKSADIIIFLDVSRRVCFWRTLKRNWRYLFSSRPELPPQCPEILIIPKLCRIIWKFPSAVRPSIINHMEKLPISKQGFSPKTKQDYTKLYEYLNSLC